MRTFGAFAAVVAPLALGSCLLGVPALENAAIDGRWSIIIKSEVDQCMFDGWTPGTVAGLEIVIDQFGDGGRDVKARLDGLAGLGFWLALGTAELSGRIEGDQLSLTMLGINDEKALNGCVFRRELRVTAQVDGDRLRQGRIVHIPTAGTAPECQMFVSCQALQSFDGTKVGQ